MSGEQLRRLLVVVLGPLWVRTFRDPVREGHLRLDPLSRPEKQLTRCGLVMLGLLLVSVLFADQWRRGPLAQLFGVDELRFVPVAALPVTLLGFLLAWALITWGALDASPGVRVVVAVLFAATNSTFALSAQLTGAGSWALEHGHVLVDTGYWLTVAVLLLAAALHPVLRARPRAARVVTGVLRVVLLVALALVFGTVLWLHVAFAGSGFGVNVVGILDSSIGLLAAFLVPLVYVAAVTVIDFALDVSRSLAEPVRLLSRRWVLAVLVALLAVKVLVQVVLRWSEWTAEVRYQPVAFTRTVVALALLALLVAVVTRFPRTDDFALAKERTMYGASFALVTPYLLSVLGTGVAFLVLAIAGSDAGTEVNDAVPYGWLGTEGLALAAVATVAVGVWLMRRSAGGFGDELGSALVVVGAWNVGLLAVAVLDLSLGWSFGSFDVLVTLAVVVLLVVGGRSLSVEALVALATTVVFSWLVASRGDYISFLGALVGLPGIVVVVVGVVLTLASGSSFASSASRRLPTDARPLLFVGYLLFSVVILHWVELGHTAGQDDDSLAGWIYIGVPMAAWLLGRQIVPRPALQEPSEPQAAAVRR